LVANNRFVPHFGEVWDVVGQTVAQIKEPLRAALKKTGGTAVVLKGFQFDSNHSEVFIMFKAFALVQDHVLDCFSARNQR
jgi:hypothetical protein